jgi:hypothetical protein
MHLQLRHSTSALRTRPLCASLSAMVLTHCAECAALCCAHAYDWPVVSVVVRASSSCSVHRPSPSVSVVSSPLTPSPSAAPAVKKEEETQDGKAAAAASPFLLPRGKAHGAADGWNDSAPGFWHNTRLGPGRHSGETDPDRHTRRPTHHGAMKCAHCFHYFKLSDGVCANCGARAPSSAAAW